MVELFKCIVLGHRCPWGCGTRAHDMLMHYRIDHAGDRL